MKTSILFLLILPTHLTISQPIVYPLHPGDRWYYNPSGWGIITSAFIEKDTIMANRHSYAIVIYNEGSWKIYERQIGDSVFRYDPQTQIENLWYDFSLSPGDTVNSIPHGTDTTDIIFAFHRIDTVFGIARRQWGFWIDYYRRKIDDEGAIVITDSLGLSDYTWCWGFSVLRGAIINNVSYGSITAIELNDQSMPAAFDLYQNYPNPCLSGSPAGRAGRQAFNPSTTIEFSIPRSEHVGLRLYNILGEEVRTLVNERMNAGHHVVTLHADDLPSGVYFYRLQAGKFINTKKMILIR